MSRGKQLYDTYIHIRIIYYRYTSGASVGFPKMNRKWGHTPATAELRTETCKRRTNYTLYEARGIKCRRLRKTFAYHPAMAIVVNRRWINRLLYYFSYSSSSLLLWSFTPNDVIPHTYTEGKRYYNE